MQIKILENKLNFSNRKYKYLGINNTNMFLFYSHSNFDENIYLPVEGDVIKN